MQFFKNGAGAGIGLKKGEEAGGSQGGAGVGVKGGQSTGLAESGSGSASAAGSTSGDSANSTDTKDKNAGSILAPSSITPMIVGVLATSFTMFSSFLL